MVQGDRHLREKSYLEAAYSKELREYRTLFCEDFEEAYCVQLSCVPLCVRKGEHTGMR